MRTRVYSPSPRNLIQLAAALRKGELVAIPTETVYGLAANALDARACRRIFSAKRRPANDPLIVHVSGLKAAEALARFNPVARALARAFWPGPLTLVLEKSPLVPAIVTSGQASVALRSPAHPLARRLLRLTGLPLAAPSANRFGYVSPTTAEHVLDGLGGRIPHILNGGRCRVGVESTIVDARNPQRIRILRPGALDAAELTRALRAARIAASVESTKSTGPRLLAPGLLLQHYSPHTPLELRTRIRPDAIFSAGTGRIHWKRPPTRSAGRYWLSEDGDAITAARRLYAVLRKADAAGHERLVCERAPGRSALAVAINDRLERAAAKRSAH